VGSTLSRATHVALGDRDLGVRVEVALKKRDFLKTGGLQLISLGVRGS
jgi:hypothetical protein